MSGAPIHAAERRIESTQCPPARSSVATRHTGTQLGEGLIFLAH